MHKLKKSNMMNKQRRWSNVQWNNMAWVVKFNSQRFTERSTRYFTSICFGEPSEFNSKCSFDFNEIFRYEFAMIFHINDSNNDHHLMYHFTTVNSNFDSEASSDLNCSIDRRIQIRFSFAEKMSRIRRDKRDVSTICSIKAVKFFVGVSRGLESLVHKNIFRQ